MAKLSLNREMIEARLTNIRDCLICFEAGLEYKSIAKVLGDKGVISREMAERLVPIAG